MAERCTPGHLPVLQLIRGSLGFQMDKIIIIVGTNHEFQWADKCRLLEEIDKFRDYLSRLVKKYNIRAIAEEMSIEALKTNGQEESIPFKIAQSYQISHQYSDPTLDEQSKLNIMNEGTIEYYGKYKYNWSKDEIQDRIKAAYRKREAVWIKKIQDLNTWPLLFVCGSEHVTPFCSQLCEQDYTVKIETNNWTT